MKNLWFVNGMLIENILFFQDWKEDASDLMAGTLNLSEEIPGINVSNESG